MSSAWLRRADPPWLGKPGRYLCRIPDTQSIRTEKLTAFLNKEESSNISTWKQDSIAIARIYIKYLDSEWLRVLLFKSTNVI